MSIRLRLALVSGALFLTSGAILLAITYLIVRFAFPAAPVHTYSATRVPDAHATASPPAPARLPSPAALLADDAAQHESDLNHLLLVSGLALAALALASVLLGWFVAGRMLRPLRTITAAARAISSAGLHRRLALAGPDDELKELADTFDALLGRLERSFAAQRQFIANASHELRTPLTLERALLDAALTDPHRNLDSLTATCERLIVSNAQQERLIEALLTLATSERGIEQQDSIDLARLAEQCLAQRRAEAESAKLDVSTDLREAPTTGDPELTGRLIANLLENALRYNVPGGRIEIATGLEPDERTAVLRVGNTGPVVAADEIAELFEPFRRATGSRSHHGPGHGLGLSIVSAVATAHSASVDTRARPDGGLDVEVRYPAVRP
jgi:signal transduction histidine kinase